MAYAFSALYAHVLNTTVTHEKVQFLPIQAKGDWTETKWILSALDRGIGRSIELTNGSWLYAGQTLGVRRSDRDGQLWLTTLRYKYQWQADEAGKDWWVRWDYRREAPDGTELPREERAHIHFNATPNAYQGAYFPKLHLPVSRIGIEDLARFLLDEGGCVAISGQCDEVIEEAREIFTRIQRPA